MRCRDQDGRERKIKREKMRLRDTETGRKTGIDRKEADGETAAVFARN